MTNIREPIKKVGQDYLIYGIGNLFTKIAAILLIPIYTKYLSVNEVGVIAVIEMIEQLMLPFALSGLSNALWRFLGKQDTIHSNQVISSGFWGSIFIGLLVLITSIFFIPDIGRFLFLDSQEYWFLYPVLLNVLFITSIRFFMRILQYQRKAFLFSIISISQLAGILGLSIILVTQCNWGLRGVILAKSIVNGILFIPILLIMIIKFSSSFSFSVFKKMTIYGYPFLPMTLALTILNFSDRYFLNLFVPQSEIGIYSIAYRIGMIIQMFLVLPLYMSFLPMVFRIGVDSKQNKDIIRDTMFYYSVLGCFLFLVVTLFSQELILIIATDVYTVGSKFIPIILLAYFINGFRQFFMAVPALKDKTKQLGLISLGVIGINLVFNWVFISTFGTIGAAISTILSFVILTVAVYFLSQQEVKIHWKWKRILICCFFSGFIFLIVQELKLSYKLSSLIINIAGLVLFPIVLYFFKVIGSKELKGIKHLFTSILTK